MWANRLFEFIWSANKFSNILITAEALWLRVCLCETRNSSENARERVSERNANQKERVWHTRSTFDVCKPKIHFSEKGFCCAFRNHNSALGS